VTVKLVVVYPRPKDIEAFERVNKRDHVPMAVDKLAGKTMIVATKMLEGVSSIPDGDEKAGQMKEAAIDAENAVLAHEEEATVLQPSEGALHLPALFVTVKSRSDSMAELHSANIRAWEHDKVALELFDRAEIHELENAQETCFPTRIERECVEPSQANGRGGRLTDLIRARPTTLDSGPGRPGEIENGGRRGLRTNL